MPPPYDLKANHYNLGNDKPVYDVSYKTDFGWKDPEIGEQNKALMKDLRGMNFLISAHHFAFGNDPANFTSENAAHFKEPKRDENKVDVMNPYKNSYKIGDGTNGQKDHYKSVYKELMTEQPINSAEVNRKSSMDQLTSIKIGFPEYNYKGVSEFADKYASS